MRERQFNCVVGQRGSGKSTLVAKLAKNYNGNVCVVKHPTNIEDNAFSFLAQKTQTSWRQGVAPNQPAKFKISVETGQEYKELITWIINGNFRNGMLVIDDATIFERDRMSIELNKLVTMCRHLGIDLYLVYHGLTLFPIEQYIFLNYLIIFNTNDNVDYKKNKIPEFTKVKAAVLKARNNFLSNDPSKKYSPVVLKIS